MYKCVYNENRTKLHTSAVQTFVNHSWGERGILKCDTSLVPLQLAKPSYRDTSASQPVAQLNFA